MALYLNSTERTSCWTMCNTAVLSHMTPCALLDRQMEETGSSETPVPSCHTIWRHIPEETIMVTAVIRGVKIYHKSRSHLKILGAKVVTQVPRWGPTQTSSHQIQSSEVPGFRDLYTPGRDNTLSSFLGFSAFVIYLAVNWNNMTKPNEIKVT